MTAPTAAFFAMPQEGHFQTLGPLISGLAARGITPHVFTARAFSDDVVRWGGVFEDLFSRYPIEAADAESFPAPCRYVTFAGHYADEIVRELAELGPSLVLHDQHAVVGRVVGTALGVPHVCVTPAHAVTPDRLPELLATLPHTDVSDGCARAVAVLRERYGIDDASPFSFATALSPHLNVYGEPPGFLDDGDRRALEPVAFHGCLPSLADIEASADGPPCFDAGGSGPRVYVSFGTVVWRYWPAEALDAMTVIAAALARQEVRALISLGGATLAPGVVSALRSPNVAVAGYVDQWRALREADAFVTHNGLKSTHEAIFNGVPMLSYPFMWDQPALAGRCQTLGLAIPLGAAPRAGLQEVEVVAALAELLEARASMGARLADAREWELETIAERGAVVGRIAGLVGS